MRPQSRHVEEARLRRLRREDARVDVEWLRSRPRSVRRRGRAGRGARQCGDARQCRTQSPRSSGTPSGALGSARTSTRDRSAWRWLPGSRTSSTSGTGPCRGTRRRARGTLSSSSRVPAPGRACCSLGGGTPNARRAPRSRGTPSCTGTVARSGAPSGGQSHALVVQLATHARDVTLLDARHARRVERARPSLRGLGRSLTSNQCALERSLSARREGEASQGTRVDELVLARGVYKRARPQNTDLPRGGSGARWAAVIRSRSRCM